MEFNFTTYMRTIARQLIAIAWDPEDTDAKKFFRISSVVNMDELIQSLSGAASPCIVVEDTRVGRLMDRGSLNFLNNQSYTFMVLVQGETGNAEENEACKDTAWDITKAILSRFMKDYHSDQRPPVVTKTGMRNIDWESISYQSVGPYGDSFFGIMVQFTMLNPINKQLVYNENEWDTNNS